MSTYDVKTFDVKSKRKAHTELADYLNELASEGWNVVSVASGPKVRYFGSLGDPPKSFLVVVSRP